MEEPKPEEAPPREAIKTSSKEEETINEEQSKSVKPQSKENEPAIEKAEEIVEPSSNEEETKSEALKETVKLHSNKVETKKEKTNPKSVDHIETVVTVSDDGVVTIDEDVTPAVESDDTPSPSSTSTDVGPPMKTKNNTTDSETASPAPTDGPPLDPESVNKKQKASALSDAELEAEAEALEKQLTVVEEEVIREGLAADDTPPKQQDANTVFRSEIPESESKKEDEKAQKAYTGERENERKELLSQVKAAELTSTLRDEAALCEDLKDEKARTDCQREFQELETEEEAQEAKVCIIWESIGI